MKLPAVFLDLAKLYQKHGFSLYLIGGTSRDLLLDIPFDDYDFVTDATPEQEKEFLPDANYRFACFGSIKVHYEGISIDITTLRKESEYTDHRHPAKIEFIKDIETDSWRRDFTVNALYIDAKGTIYDFHNGMADLAAKTLRFIGDPRQRILEDPLRILRAERFASHLGFTVEKESAQAMDELREQLNQLNPDKVLLESKKKR